MMADVLVGCGSSNEQAANTSQEVQAETVAEPETASNAPEESEGVSAEEDNTEESGTEETAGKTLVVYFSASGNTDRVAEVIAGITGGELFELVPVEPYTDEDLDWTDDNNRVTIAHENPEQREVELAADTVEDWQEGMRFQSSVSEEDVITWVESLGLNKSSSL